MKCLIFVYITMVGAFSFGGPIGPNDIVRANMAGGIGKYSLSGGKCGFRVEKNPLFETRHPYFDVFEFEVRFSRPGWSVAEQISGKKYESYGLSPVYVQGNLMVAAHIDEKNYFVFDLSSLKIVQIKYSGTNEICQLN